MANMWKTLAGVAGVLSLLVACSGSFSSVSDGSTAGDGGTDGAAEDAAACGPPTPAHCICGVPQTCVNGTWTCACGGDAGVPPLHASDYNQACKRADDCVPVTEGTPCGCLGCSQNAAINRSDQSKYQSDFTTRQAECPVTGIQCTQPPCAYLGAYCNAGTCAICHDQVCASLLRAGDGCDPNNDQCGTGLACCAQGGIALPDGGVPGKPICMQANSTPGGGPVCPVF